MQRWEVREFLDMNPNVEWDLKKWSITGDGKLYRVDDNWELGSFVREIEEPKDGEDHYCWSIVWSPTGYTFAGFVAVYIDRSSWEVVRVVYAKWI